jgi:hypothetical protein
VLYQLSYTPKDPRVAADPGRFKHRQCPDCKGEAGWLQTTYPTPSFCARIRPSRATGKQQDQRETP